MKNPGEQFRNRVRELAVAAGSATAYAIDCELDAAEAKRKFIEAEEVAIQAREKANLYQSVMYQFLGAGYRNMDGLPLIPVLGLGQTPTQQFRFDPQVLAMVLREDSPFTGMQASDRMVYHQEMKEKTKEGPTTSAQEETSTPTAD